jgi:hypothetical protein
MYRLRNRISHEYFGIDYEIIWDIATRHLPKNYADVQVVLAEEREKRFYLFIPCNVPHCPYLKIHTK